MMHADAPLELFPTSVVPQGRRAEMRQLLQERRATVSRVVSSGVLLAMCAGFGVFYGSFCVYAWKHDMHPAVGVVFSILSGITLISAGVMAYRFREELARVAAVPDKLRREAGAEEALETAVLDVNLSSIFWNEMARSAIANAVDASIVRGLIVQRGDIERRRCEVEDGLRRFAIATAPELEIVSPPAAWGPIETIDLSGDTDS